MTVYKTIVSPTVVKPFAIKIEDQSASLQDYGLFKFLSLDRTYSEVYLKTIRFTIVYPTQGTHNAQGDIFHPYQIHLRWLDEMNLQFEPGEILQNTMAHNETTGILFQETNMDMYKPTYSTFCQFHSAAELLEPNTGTSGSQYNHGHMQWLFYNLERNALIKRGSFSALNFQLILTNLKGQQYMRYLPNIEIEFELF